MQKSERNVEPLFRKKENSFMIFVEIDKFMWLKIVFDRRNIHSFLHFNG